MEKNTFDIVRTIGRANSKFIQIPGPNPILVPGSKKEWDEGVIECCNVLKDQNTYYLYYHGTPKDKKLWSPLGYRIGVATATPFWLTMPVLSIDTLDAASTSKLIDCHPISLQNISDLSLTTECTYHTAAKAGLRIHIKASYDGIGYNTEDLYTFDMPFKRGKRISKTVELNSKVMFIKVVVENLDKSGKITDLKITAALGS